MCSWGMRQLLDVPHNNLGLCGTLTMCPNENKQLGVIFSKTNWFLQPDVVKITLKSLFSFYQSGVQTLDAYKEFLLTDHRNIVINNFLIHGFLEFFGRNNCWISREKFKPFLIHTGSSLPLGFNLKPLRIKRKTINIINELIFPYEYT